MILKLPKKYYDEAKKKGFIKTGFDIVKKGIINNRLSQYEKNKLEVQLINN